VPAREWTSSNGKFTIEAEFVAVKSGKVVLEKPDGTFVSVPLDKLSPKDQAFVASETGDSLKTDEPDDQELSVTRSGDLPLVKLKGEKPDDPPGEARAFPEMGWGVKSLTFSPNGGLLAAGKMDRAVLLFDVSEGSRKTTIDKLETLGQVSSITFTPDGKKLLAGGDRGLITVWNVSKTGQLDATGQFAGHTKGVNCIAISADGKFALSGDDQRVRYWQIDNGKEITAYEGLQRSVKACRISKDGRTAWATDGETLLTINLKTERTNANKFGKSIGQFAAISGDGRLLASGEGYNVRLFDIKENKDLGLLEEQEIQWSGEFLPDGLRLVTGSAGKINVWDLTRKSRTTVIPTKGTGYVQCLAVSPDNWHIAAIPSSAGQTLQVLRLPKD
jgi:WD40 repeat protein